MRVSYHILRQRHYQFLRGESVPHGARNNAWRFEVGQLRCQRSCRRFNADGRIKVITNYQINAASWFITTNHLSQRQTWDTCYQRKLFARHQTASLLRKPSCRLVFKRCQSRWRYGLRRSDRIQYRGVRGNLRRHSAVIGEFWQTANLKAEGTRIRLFESLLTAHGQDRTRTAAA